MYEKLLKKNNVEVQVRVGHCVREPVKKEQCSGTSES